MTGRGAVPSVEYSPQRRTALLLTGTGTAGAYHAGVLRALHEAGVKLDIVAGRGVGVVGALFAAVDAAPHLWGEKGFWQHAAVRGFYPWRPSLRLLGLAIVAAIAVVAIPMLAIALGLIVYPIDFVLKMVGASGGGLVGWYVGVANAAFAPEAFPTWLPRLAVLILGGAGTVAALSALRRTNTRHARGAWWWRVVPSPLVSAPAVQHVWSSLWDLVRGAAHVRLPAPVDLARRYTEMLGENLGQPGFRELLVAVHDVDASRDLVFALVNDARRRDLIRRPSTDEAEERRAEVFDLAGVARDHLADAVAAALTVPMATDLHDVRFAVDSYWRGETHRLCDRPGAIVRLLEELAALDVEQIILVSAAPDASSPHALSAPRLEGRARAGEYLRSTETAVLRDALVSRGTNEPRLFVIRPSHNPVGPFDFDGGFDDRSDRALTLGELMNRGYEDAYHAFIEPIVGASGEHVGIQP